MVNYEIKNIKKNETFYDNLDTIGFDILLGPTL